jgi:hypothetical protein
MVQLIIGIFIHAFLLSYTMKRRCGEVKWTYNKSCGYSILVLVIGLLLYAIVTFVYGFVTVLVGVETPFLQLENFNENIGKIKIHLWIILGITLPFVWFIAAAIYGKFIKNEVGIPIGMWKGFFVFADSSVLLIVLYGIISLNSLLGIK